MVRTEFVFSVFFSFSGGGGRAVFCCCFSFFLVWMSLPPCCFFKEVCLTCSWFAVYFWYTEKLKSEV